MPCFAAERGPKFWTLSFIFQSGNRNFGIGDYLSVYVNHSGAGASVLAFLRGDVFNLAGVISVDAAGKQLRLLGEAAFDFRAQDAPPVTIRGVTHADRGGSDHRQK